MSFLAAKARDYWMKGCNTDSTSPLRPTKHIQQYFIPNYQPDVVPYQKNWQKKQVQPFPITLVWIHKHPSSIAEYGDRQVEHNCPNSLLLIVPNGHTGGYFHIHILSNSIFPHLDHSQWHTDTFTDWQK